MELTDFVGVGGFPIVVGVTQVIKNNFPSVSDGVTVGVALGTSELWALGVAGVLHNNPGIAALLGIVVWLMAMGAWSGTRSLLGK